MHKKLVIRNLNQQKAETWNELNERNVGLVNFVKGKYLLELLKMLFQKNLKE